ncbi:hypothetical protein BO94DRAFT_596280 [Aspergillus sclerotioniger CBS 115572]|uniref:CoA-dependent acyltransferase n=1 Tax=Aspergillus sclerotioniger CBS 115572 TaxID=1450535 RepID=A0A317WPC5_9EURO|nr:hypothetical protein BO94DRAFT_596280 [Aspergillus sclerotioniger CBS 115572]PWY87112.1 hypothetical protein BO94DRAFT_596280 [Aspergillus sclerotioniger CBS 115572]
MSWTQVSPTRYERSFDSLEVFYRAIADAGAALNKQHYLISSVTRLKASLPPAQIQQAWKNLSQQHPQIAAVAESNTRLVYTVPSPAELNAWVEDTFLVKPDISAAHLIPTLEPTTVFRLYYLPQSRELLWRTPHWRIDGFGLLHLQASFFDLLSGTTTPDPSVTNLLTRLNPTLDEIIFQPNTLTPEEMKSAADAELSIVLDNAPTAISMPTLPNILPTTTRTTQTIIPAETTTQIIAACKDQGITITTALHAAFAVAMLPHAQHNFDPSTRGQPGGTYTTLNTFSLRRYMPAPFNGPSAAVSIYHTGLGISIDLSSHRDFSSIASVLGKGYSRNLGAEEPRNVFAFLPQYVKQVLELFSIQPEDPLHGPAVPVFVSMGRVNDSLGSQYGEVEIEDWWIGVEVLSRELVVHVWSWKGELRLGVCWNEAFYEDVFVKGIMNAWRGVLVGELCG